MESGFISGEKMEEEFEEMERIMQLGRTTSKRGKESLGKTEYETIGPSLGDQDLANEPNPLATNDIDEHEKMVKDFEVQAEYYMLAANRLNSPICNHLRDYLLTDQGLPYHSVMYDSIIDDKGFYMWSLAGSYIVKEDRQKMLDKLIPPEQSVMTLSDTTRRFYNSENIHRICKLFVYHFVTAIFAMIRSGVTEHDQIAGYLSKWSPVFMKVHDVNMLTAMILEAENISKRVDYIQKNYDFTLWQNICLSEMSKEPSIEKTMFFFGNFMANCMAFCYRGKSRLLDSTTMYDMKVLLKKGLMQFQKALDELTAVEFNERVREAKHLIKRKVKVLKTRKTWKDVGRGEGTTKKIIVDAPPMRAPSINPLLLPISVQERQALEETQADLKARINFMLNAIDYVDGGDRYKMHYTNEEQIMFFLDSLK